MRDDNYLFIGNDLRAILENREHEMFSEIESFNSVELVNASDEIIAESFFNKYSLELPRLIEDKITQKKEETQVDVSQDFNRGIHDRSRPYYLTGTKITFFVPFEGNGGLFNYQSSTYSLNPPCAVVRNGEILVTFSFLNHDVQAIKKQFEGTLAQIKQLLVGTGNDVGIYNEGLKQKAINRIKTRREKILKDQKFVDELGFPSHD